MNPPQLLRPILELTILFPGCILALIPVKIYLKLPLRRILPPLLAALALYCLGMGQLCYINHWGTRLPVACAVLVLTLFYRSLVRLPLWKVLNIPLAICGVHTSATLITVAVDYLFRPLNVLPWFSFEAGLFLNLLCWGFTLVSWYPASHQVRWMLKESNIAQTWYTFWTLPVALIFLSQFLIPQDYSLIKMGRAFQLVVVVGCFLLILLALSYLMFYLMAKALDANTRLRHENQFLQMQQAQYDALQTAIAETRHARHDLRHHMNTLSALADREDWDSLRGYLEQARASIPRSELNLCANPAVDGVAGHYTALCQRDGVSLTCRLDLPRQLPVDEMDLCLVLSNLLENALEASLRAPKELRMIRVEAVLHAEQVVLLTVENSYSGHVQEVDGVFQSRKRKGKGVGLQSVRHIAEKTGGFCNFTYDGRRFTAEVMLVGSPPAPPPRAGHP